MLGVVNNPMTKRTQLIYFKRRSLHSREEKASSLLCRFKIKNLTQQNPTHAELTTPACLLACVTEGGLRIGASGESLVGDLAFESFS